MVKKHQVRGDEDEIFYAKFSDERAQIWKLFLHDTIQDKLVNSQIYELDSHILAFEEDFNYTEMKQKEVMKRFYVLNKEQ